MKLKKCNESQKNESVLFRKLRIEINRRVTIKLASFRHSVSRGKTERIGEKRGAERQQDSLSFRRSAVFLGYDPPD